ncbi:MAG: hypothetical protein AB7R67_19005 [Vicinamibacterales bacterium]
MKSIVALKECPQGQQPGDQFDVPDEHAAVLVGVGAAKYAAKEPSTRGSYRRRDLRADEHAIESKVETTEP